MERLDALAVRESNGKSYFTRVGVAFANKDGKGFSVLLDAIPAPADGQFKIMLREPLPKDSQSRGETRSRGNDRGGSYGRDLDDEIGF